MATPLQKEILNVLINSADPLTSAEIGELVGVSARAASNALALMRGEGLVSDGKPWTCWHGNIQVASIPERWPATPRKWGVMSQHEIDQIAIARSYLKKH